LKEGVGMSKVLKLKCVKCGKEYNPAEVLYTCPDCGIDGILDEFWIMTRLKRN
jgi:threonine synthase